MNGRSSSARWWLVQGLTVLGLGAVFAVYFLVYLPTRTTNLTERNFRVLGDMSEQIADAMANLHTTLTNAAHNAVAKATITNNVVITNNVAAAFITSVRQLKISVVDPFTNGAMPSRYHVTNSVSRQVNSYRLDLAYKDSTQTNLPTIFRVSADFGDLLRPILVRHDFADLLLVNHQGKVIFQLDEAEPRITNLVSSSDLRIARLPEFDERIETNRLRKATGVMHIPILDKEYKLFSQPITFSLNSGDDAPPTEWFLAGLVPARTFSARAWELPSTVLILFIFVALVGLLSWPFLNVAFSSPRQELSRAQVAAVLGATFFGCAALTFLLLDNNIYPTLEDDLDAELDLLSAHVETNFNAELAQARTQLLELNAQLSKEAHAVGTDTELASFRSKSRILTNQTIFSSLTNSPYPFLTLVNWLNRDGFQVVKWTTLSEPTRAMTVGDRSYFRSIPEGWAWPWHPARPDDPDRFFVECIFSRGRGENAAVFSMPWTNAWPGGASLLADPTNRIAVACLEFRPLSLSQPVLPSGYGFCLIETSGKVLFHSDERRNLRENFIQETGRNPRVRAAVHARSVDHFDVSYLNQTHHVRISPLRQVPWTLVVFRHEKMLRCVHQNLLSAAGLLFSFYLTLLLLILLCVVLPARVWRTVTGGRNDYWLRWIWPKRSWRASSSAAVILLFGAVAALLGVLHSGHAGAVLVWGVAVPWLVIVLTQIWHRMPTRFTTGAHKLAHSGLRQGTEFFRRNSSSAGTPHRRSSRSFPAHILSMGGTFMLIAMLPALACYKVAFLRETELFVKGTQLELGRHLGQRLVRLRIQERQAGTSNLWEKLAYPGGLYYENFFATAFTKDSPTSAEAHAEPDSVTDLYAASRVYFNESHLKNGGLLGSHAADDSWVAVRQGESLLFQQGAITIRSRIPTMKWPELEGDEGVVWFLWYVGLFILLSTPFLISTFITRRILLFALPRAVRELGSGRQQIERLPNAEKAPDQAREWVALEAHRVQVIDVKSDKDRRWLNRGGWKKLEPGAVIALANTGAIASKRLQQLLKDCLAHLELDRDKTVVEVGPEMVSRPEEIAAMLRDWHFSELERCSAQRTEPEKIALYQIARSGFANGLRPELYALFTAGLLRCDPELRLRNESLRRYVLARFAETAAQAKVSVSEGDTSASRWRAVRSALGIGLAICALFLFITQREIWQLAIGLTSSFAAGFGELSKLSQIFQKKGPSGGSSG